MNKYLLFLIIPLLTTACVGKKKFLTEVNQRQDCEKKAAQLTQDLRYAQSRMAEQDKSLTDLNANVRQLENDKGRLTTELKYKEKQINDITDQRLSQKQQMEAALAAKAKELEAREQVIAELQLAVAQRDEKLNGILTKIQIALAQYTADDLSVEVKNGKLYVALSDKLLFESGSAKMDRRGRDALSSLSNVLSKYPDLDIIVEGHTDNVPVKGGAFADNWDLSVIRATAVARLLTKDYALNPNQVTAAGRGEFQPKASNESREGRALNRRTEIIIAPKLNDIFSVLQQQSR
ncbi:MAG: OmpA family protein [Saprospiraceae bacterium]|nr:OmpA family protein [Saprospiraceae bacterium]